MKDPKRWLAADDTPAHVRALLHAGDPLPPVPASTARELATFAQGLAAQGTLTAVTGSLVTVKLVLALAVAGAAFGTGTYLWTAAPSVSPSAPATAPTTPSSTTPPPAERPEPPPAPAAPRTARLTPSQPASAVASSAAPPSPPAPSVAAFGTVDLAAEAALLERARAALAASPERALALTGDHRRAFPDGQLAAERELIAIDALVRTGRRAEAERRAAPLRAGDSAYARRVRLLLGEDP